MRALALAIFLGLGLAQVEIPLWHTLGEGGFLEAEAEAFNRSQGTIGSSASSSPPRCATARRLP